MNRLTDDDVTRALAAAREAADGLPHSFATCVVDAGGHVLGLLRDTAAAVAAAHSAESKARTAVHLLADTGALPPTSPLVPALVSGLPHPVNVFPGGLLLRRGGEVVGAVGVGGSPDAGDDLAVARAARRAVEDPAERRERRAGHEQGAC
ncbi:heme-binding protein [Streptacidiphilus sp. ASG 303]|uniref:heme-binding protein n=1 Tax=Streptacidiphilus sp. ASG 303 TaxID=2896847 RepID=UPI001E5FE0A6|nr:heme-binding protein [Streptacidiphilus sp. ASG 303]MCD0483645.1 heme-binding protein [Streptacidiphilus sp. ASG 303]